ncbi:MAG: ATP-binding protein [Desulfobulbaceae bacterium]|nr:ATP-binding protein [Desulfobulbaceae bacterium]MCK5404995.1 ATP-binding protein [Desulfobulbaceae bacterium]
MKLAIASGKGGTGKTTVAVSLALTAAEKGPVQFLDCDVEAPNGHIFLKPHIQESTHCFLTVPSVLEEKCTYCGKCKDICRYKAITVFGETIMFFKEMCHSCGGCFLVCPEDALIEDRREIGVVEKGHARNIAFVHGKLRIGEAMAPPLIKAVKEEISPNGLAIIDAPPGTSCPVIEVLKDADFTILVTEPTPFGLHDLQLTVDVLRILQKPFSVILNRADLGDNRTEQWCRDQHIPILMKIPFDRGIAEDYAIGKALVVSRPDMKESFAAVLAEVVK